jgi:hypothetical protein
MAGIQLSQFLSHTSMTVCTSHVLLLSTFSQSDDCVLQPIHAWDDMPMPSIYGLTVISGVTFGAYGSTNCFPADRNVAITGTGRSGMNSDAWHPASLSNIELVDVEEDSKVFIVPTSPDWINQGNSFFFIRDFQSLSCEADIFF